jgi:hypothetical protein
MSMTVSYVAIRANELEELRGSKKSFDTILNETNPEYFLAVKADPVELACRRYARADYLNRKPIAEKAGMAETNILTEIRTRNIHIWCDLDQLWNEMHMLLTGSEFPLKLANAPRTANQKNSLLSTAVIGEDNLPGCEDYGYGPARYIEPSTVKDVSAALAKLKFAQLSAEHDMEDEDLEEIFDDFKLFYTRAALNNDAVALVYL